MYTDKDYLVKDRFREKRTDKNVNTFYDEQKRGSITSIVDPDSVITDGNKTIPNHATGLENLYNLKTVYLFKRLEMDQEDVFNDYKGEIIDEQGNRIFLITSAAHHTSDEVIHYGKHKAVKIKGKVNYGALNHAGIQLFEIHGDPEKVIRVGPPSGLWGEVQVLPGDAWKRIQLTCCCIKMGSKVAPSETAEIRVIVIKRDNRNRAFVEKTDTDTGHGDVFKQVYTLRGRISTGCKNQSSQNFLYKKTFDLKIYVEDPFKEEKMKEDVPVVVEEEEEEESEEDDEDEEDETAPNDSNPPSHKPHVPHVHKSMAQKPLEPPAQKPTTNPAKPQLEEKQSVDKNPEPEKVENKEPIGRICSQALHEKLKLHLPILEFPRDINVYDKLTLMATFFLFNLKI